MRFGFYEKLIVLLLVLQADVTGFLVGLGLFGAASEATFALFLAIELIVFAMTSYVFLAQKNNELPNRVWIIAGSTVVGALLLSSLVLL